MSGRHGSLGHVKAYVKRNKNDASDAEAICEAVRRPTMRFITFKTAKQQGRLMQHQLMRPRTQLINALRSPMAELGIVAAQGREALKELLVAIAQLHDKNAFAHAAPAAIAARTGSSMRNVEP